MSHEQPPIPAPIDLSYLAEHPDELAVSNSGIIHMQVIRDNAVLRVASAGENIPFPKMLRVYDIDELSAPEELRGRHAHKTLKQVIRVLRGSFNLVLDDGKSKQTIRMNTPNKGIFLNGLIWHDMVSFSSDCLILVYAEELYDESDYVRDYEEFKRLVADEKRIDKAIQAA